MLSRFDFSRQYISAISRVEVLFLIFIVVYAALLIAPNFARGKHGKGHARIKCVNHLKNIGLAYRIFATDHSDLFPFEMPIGGTRHLTNSSDVFLQFLALSNELNTPQLLRCPMDNGRAIATNFSQLRNEQISYFVGISSSERHPNSILSGDRNLELDGRKLSPGRIALDPAGPEITGAEAAGLLWGSGLHNRLGNVAFGDGSVRQLDQAQLRTVFRESGQTNILLIP